MIKEKIRDINKRYEMRDAKYKWRLCLHLLSPISYLTLLISYLLSAICIFSYLLSPICLYADIEKDAEEKASALYVTQAKTKKDKITFYISRGDEYLISGKYSYAIDSYNEARKLKRKNPKVLFRLGEAYRLADMKDEAIELYDKALKYGANDIRIFLGLGSIYKSKFLYEKSERFYKKVLTTERNNLPAMKNLAKLYEYKSEYKNALILYKKIFSIESSDEIKLKMAFLYLMLGKSGDAEKYLNELPESGILAGYLNLKKNPDIAIEKLVSANEYFLRAVAYLRNNDIINARKNLEVLIKQDENTLSKKLAVALIEKIK